MTCRSNKKEEKLGQVHCVEITGMKSSQAGRERYINKMVLHQKNPMLREERILQS